MNTPSNVSQAFSLYLANHCQPDMIAARWDGSVNPFLRAFNNSAEGKAYFAGIKLGMVMAETAYIERSAAKLIAAFAKIELVSAS